MGKITRDELGVSLVTELNTINTQLVEIAVLPNAFGIKGDGVTDDTTAIQNMLNSLPINSVAKGLKVKLPSGKYKITSLNMPSGVTLEGDYAFDPIDMTGTILYCTDLTNPAIKLNYGSSIKNIAFYYPNQTWDSTNFKPMYVYPATLQVQLNAKRILIESIFFINSYYGIDIDRHHETVTIRDINGYCINQGIISDYCSDIDRYENIHLNYNALSNAGDPNASNFGNWTRNNGAAFTIKQSDWLILDGCFCWGYRSGYVFTNSTNVDGGIPFGVHVSKCGADACGTDVQIDVGQGIEFNECFFTHFNSFTAGQSTSNSAISVNNGKDIVIKNSRFWGCDGNCITVNCDSSIIEGNVFYDYGNRAVVNSADCRAIVLDVGKHIIANNQFYGNSRDRVYGILNNSNSNSMLVEGNTFNNYIKPLISNLSDNIKIGINNYINCTGTRIILTGTETNYFINDNGISQKNHLYAHSSTNQSIPSGTDTKVSFDVIDRNDGIANINSNVDLQVVTTGVYLVSIYLIFDDSTTVKQIKITNNSNGNVITSHTTTSAEVTLNFAYAFNANEIFNLYINQSKGSTINITSAASHRPKITITKIG